MTWQVIIPLLSVAVISLAFGYSLGHYNGRSGKCKDKKLFGILPVDGCDYDKTAVYKNVTAVFCKCKKCGHRKIMWRSQENTKKIEEETEDKPNENQT